MCKTDITYADYVQESIYISIYNSDNFQGLIIPKEFEYIIEVVENNSKYIIDSIFDDYETYRDYEVECASQARHGSRGSEKLNNKTGIINYFINMYNEKLNTELKKLL